MLINQHFLANNTNNNEKKNNNKKKKQSDNNNNTRVLVKKVTFHEYRRIAQIGKQQGSDNPHVILTTTPSTHTNNDNKGRLLKGGLQHNDETWLRTITRPITRNGEVGDITTDITGGITRGIIVAIPVEQTVKGIQGCLTGWNRRLLRMEVRLKAGWEEGD